MRIADQTATPGASGLPLAALAAADQDVDYPTEEPEAEQEPPEDEDTDYPTEEPEAEQEPPEDEDTDYPVPGR